MSGKALAPLRLIAPGGVGRVGFAAARRPRAEERLQNNDGEIPIPPWRRACCPAAGGLILASVIINHILVVISNPSVRRPTESRLRRRVAESTLHHYPAR